MKLVSGSIPNLINGVSQQPVPLRLASQAEVQENGYSSVVEGLRKRPPLILLSKVRDGVLHQPFTHVINRDVWERYVVIIENGDLRVYDLEGNSYTVNFPNGKSYLNHSSPRSGFRAVTVADFTFIVNTSVATAMSSARAPAQVHEALVWIKQGNYATNYNIFLNGAQAASLTTQDGSESSHAKDIRTDSIAERLRNQINGIAGWTCDQKGSTLRIRRSDGADFTIRTEDSFGDTAMASLKGNIQRFSELPQRAFEGFTVEVTGDNTSQWDSYYVRYHETEDGSDGRGTWRETVKPGELISFDPATMPHVLVREADHTFTFRRADWVERRVGDENSNPQPTFIGRAITDVFFHRNRLGFISDENVIFSRAGRFFNFWKTTAVQLQENDPIDVAASHVKVSLLRHAVPFNEELLLFSDQTQFILSAEDVLTPHSTVIKQITEFESSLLARPVGAGKYVYFTTTRGNFSGVREYFARPNGGGNDASDVTANIPQYIPRDVFKIAANSNEETLVLLSDQEPNRLYVYRFYYNGDESLMNSWSRWSISSEDKILNAEYIEADLVLVVQRHDGVYIAKMPTEPDYRDPGADYATHLDMRIDQSWVVTTYDPATEQTTVTLPYSVRPGVDAPLLVVTKSGVPGQIGGEIVQMEQVDDRTLILDGDHRNTEFFIGQTYEFRYQFSYPMIREDSVGGGQVAVTSGRMQLRSMTVQYNNTGFFEVRVTPEGRDTYVYTFTGRVLGSSNNVYGSVGIEEGRFRFPVMCENKRAKIELISDSFLPCNFLNAEWEAFYVSRSRRV